MTPTDTGTGSARPNLVFHNGQVLTVDRAFTRARALAVRDDRLVAVGDDTAVLALAGPDTVRVDLRGRTVMPGMIDAHAHMDREGLRRIYPSLADARSIGDVQAIVRRAVATAQPGDWVVLMPLGEPPYYSDPPASLVEQRYPDRHDLDQAAPDNPVYIRGPWGFWPDRPPFVAIANSLALRLAGIDRDTPPPCSTVEIEHDAAGEPTGRLLETHRVGVLEFTLMRAVPRFTMADRLRALREAQQLHLAAGTTGVYEGHGVAPEVLRLYQQLHDERALRVRSYLALSPTWTSRPEAESEIADWAHYAAGPGSGDEWLRLGGACLLVGGNPEVARLLRAAQPYTGWAGFVDQCHSLQEYRELVWLAARHNLRVNTIVADALPQVLETWEAVDRELPLRERRWVLMHLRSTPADAVGRIRRLGAIVTTIPGSHIYRDGAAALAADGDAERLLPHRDLVQHGIPWALASDNKPYQLAYAIWAAVARTERDQGRVVGEGQRVARADALRAATWVGAYCCFDEAQRGSLEVGKLADLIVLSGDPLTMELPALRDLRVELTMVGGQVVHGDSEIVPASLRVPRA